MTILGKFTQGRDHLEQCAALYDPQQHHSLASLYGQHPAVSGLSTQSWVLSMLGYADQAVEKAHEALALASSLNHAQSQVFALIIAAVLHHILRDVEGCQKYSEAVIALSTEHGFVYWLAWTQMIHGWTISEQGQPREAVAQIRLALVAKRATGSELGDPYFLGILADATNRSGQADDADEALAILSEALAAVEESGERWWDAELYRATGETLLAADVTSRADMHFDADMYLDAEGSFQKAIEVAQQQDARLWELRATVNLARLWQAQGKHNEARQMLTEIYDWFSEGFDTVDLKEAAALIEELS